MKAHLNVSTKECLLSFNQEKKQTGKTGRVSFTTNCLATEVDSAAIQAATKHKMQSVMLAYAQPRIEYLAKAGLQSSAAVGFRQPNSAMFAGVSIARTKRIRDVDDEFLESPDVEEMAALKKLRATEAFLQLSDDDDYENAEEGDVDMSDPVDNTVKNGAAFEDEILHLSQDKTFVNKVYTSSSSSSSSSSSREIAVNKTSQGKSIKMTFNFA